MRKLDSKVNNKAKITQYQNHLRTSLTLSITVRCFKRLTSLLQGLSLREAPSCLGKQIPSFHLTLAPTHILIKQGDDSHNGFFFLFSSWLVSWQLVAFAHTQCWIPDISVYPRARSTQALGWRHHYSVLFKGHLFSHAFKFILPSTPRPQSRPILHDGQPRAAPGTVHTKNSAKLPFWTLTIVNRCLDKKEVVERLMG